MAKAEAATDRVVLDLNSDGAPVHHLAAAGGPDPGAALAVVGDHRPSVFVRIGYEQRPVELAGDGEVDRLGGHRRGREGAGDYDCKCLVLWVVRMVRKSGGAAAVVRGGPARGANEAANPNLTVQNPRPGRGHDWRSASWERGLPAREEWRWGTGSQCEGCLRSVSVLAGWKPALPGSRRPQTKLRTQSRSRIPMLRGGNAPPLRSSIPTSAVVSVTWSCGPSGRTERGVRGRPVFVSVPQAPSIREPPALRGLERRYAGRPGSPVSPRTGKPSAAATDACRTSRVANDRLSGRGVR